MAESDKGHASGNDPDSDLDRILESLVDRIRKGDQPSASEYIRKHPHLADRIRELIPALQLLEEASCKEPEDRNRSPLVPGGSFGEANVPERLGDYRILRIIGRGGMGIVYEAEQESLGRHVALKVLPCQSLADPRRLERFQREARAAGALQHPNIVPVYGVGEASGIHYYAMQFIPGQGLNQVLVELRRLKAEAGMSGPVPASAEGEEGSARSSALNLLYGEEQTSRNEPNERARSHSSSAQAPSDTSADSSDDAMTSPRHLLAPNGDGAAGKDAYYFSRVAHLAAQVADALAYAHGRGVLHRDIKPSNLILDTRGTVWVTDFGLAKAEGSEDLTQSGELVGTLVYMAPERFQGWSDPRSDVYSLGLTLYELLTLESAFADTDRARLVRRIADEEPPRPRRLDRRVPRDLETIVLRAMAKEPGDRYQSAAAVSVDLKRFLRGEPIEAHRKSIVSRSVKWAKRRPAAAALLAVSFLAALVIFAGTVWYNARLAATAGRAERNFQKALAAVETMLSEVGSEELAGVPLMEPVRRRLLEEALTFYREFLGERGADDVVRYQAGRAYAHMAAIHDMLGQAAEARGAYEESAAILAALEHGDPAEPRYREALAGTWGGLGRLLARTHRREEARGAYGDAMRVLDALAARFPEAPEYRHALASVRSDAGELLAESGDAREAQEAFERALLERRDLAARFPERIAYQVGVVESSRLLADFLRRTGRQKEAEQGYRTALEYAAERSDDSQQTVGTRRCLAGVRYGLAALLTDLDRLAEAQAALQEAIASRAKLAADFPYVPRYEHDLAMTHVALGDVALRTRHHGDAEAAYGAALSAWRKLANYVPGEPEYRLHVAIANEKLAEVLARGRRREEAFGAVREAARIKEALAREMGEDPRYAFEHARGRDRLAAVLAEGGEYGKAEALWSEAAADLVRLVEREPGIARYRQALARIYDGMTCLLRDRLGRLDDAAGACRKALSLRSRLVEEHPEPIEYRCEFAESCRCMAALTAELGRLDEAESQLAQALAIYEQLAAGTSGTSFRVRHGAAAAHAQRSEVLDAAGRREEALAAIEPAAAALEELVGASPDFPEAYDTLCRAQAHKASLLVRANRLDDAEAACDRARGAMERFATRFPVSPIRAAATDLDRDGDHDLAVVNIGSNDVTLLSNDGRGKLSAVQNVAVGSLPYDIAVADVNGDGRADLAVSSIATGSVCVLINTGAGTFAPPARIGLRDRVFSIAAGDFDGDGDADLAACGGENSLWLLRNDGAAAFTVEAIAGASPRPHKVLAADLDGDGKLDLITMGSTAVDNLVVLWNSGGGQFESGLRVSVDEKAASVAVGDFNGDGNPDLAATARFVLILLNAGGREFSLSSKVHPGPPLDGIAAGDLDGDGDADLVVVGGQDEQNTWVLLNDGKASFTVEEGMCAGSEPTCVVAADLTGDGALDLVVTNQGSYTVSLFRGRKPEGEAARPSFQEAESLAVGLQPESRHAFARAALARGGVFLAKGALAEAANACEGAARILTELRANLPSVSRYAHELGFAFEKLAEILRAEGKAAEACAALAGAVETREVALKHNPASPSYRAALRDDYALLGDLLLAKGDHGEARRIAHLAADLHPESWEGAYDAARRVARCMSLAAQDETLPEDKRLAAASWYRSEAMALLRESAKRGFRDAERLREDTDLDPLREHEEFNSLAAELSARE